MSEANADRGQRYEVTYLDTDAGVRRLFGWAKTLEGARAFATAIERHPGMTKAEIKDRHTGEIVVTVT